MNLLRTEDNTESFKEVAALTLTSEETVTLDIPHTDFEVHCYNVSWRKDTQLKAHYFV